MGTAGHSIAPDALGVKGESRFREICADASIICNKSDRDRTGWDFIIEFEFEEAATSRPLDSRSTPLSAHVQVKTTDANNDLIKMRLSAAERLAKEIKPAFIYVFKTRGVEFTEAYLLHVFDDLLAAILQKLRQESASGGDPRVNKKFISFRASHGTRIEPSGEAFRAAVLAACGSNLHEYAARKADQVKQLGFEPLRYTGSLSFRQLNSVNELVDVFLGLKREIEVDRFEAFEVRFGIPLPILPSKPGLQVISIDPYPAAPCTVIVKSHGLNTPIGFDGELFVPAIPDLPIDSFKCLVKSSLFSLLIPFQGQLSFWQSEGIALQKYPPERWVDHARLLVALASGKLNIEIITGDKGYMDLDVEGLTINLEMSQCKRWLFLCECLSLLFESAGVTSRVRLGIEEIEASAQSVVEAFAMLNGKVTGISFATNVSQNSWAGRLSKSILASYVAIGDILLAYYLYADLTPEYRDGKIAWKSVKTTPGAVSLLSRSQAQFGEWLENVIKTQTTAEVAGTLRSLAAISPAGDRALSDLG